MKATLTDDEVAALPDEEKAKLKDNVFEGAAADFIPNVAGLKTALDKTRDEKRTQDKLLKTIAEKFGADRSTVLAALDDYIGTHGNAPVLRKELADKDLKHALEINKFNTFTVPGALKENGMIRYSEELGQYIVPGDNGEPLLNDAGALQSIEDVIVKMKGDERFDHVKKGPTQSGGGSLGEKGGATQLPAEDRSEAPPKTMRLSLMTDKQRRLAATVGGGLQEYPR